MKFSLTVQRAPGKRRVKPVPSSRVQVNFDGLDDSEEDSDFDINKHSQGELAVCVIWLCGSCFRKMANL